MPQLLARVERFLRRTLGVLVFELQKLPEILLGLAGPVQMDGRFALLQARRSPIPRMRAGNQFKAATRLLALAEGEFGFGKPGNDVEIVRLAAIALLVGPRRQIELPLGGAGIDFPARSPATMAAARPSATSPSPNRRRREPRPPATFAGLTSVGGDMGGSSRNGRMNSGMTRWPASVKRCFVWQAVGGSALLDACLLAECATRAA
jgi:hypothetical protein